MSPNKPSSIPGIHLNLNVRGLPISATLNINEISNKLQKEGREVFKMGLGQSPFPVPEQVVEALKRHAHEKDYLAVLGLWELREAVSVYLAKNEKVHFLPENIMVGPGSKELMFILQLVYYGDLLIPNPSWVSYAPQASIIGRKIRWLETDARHQWKLLPDRIDELCQKDPGRPRLVILNYPANPHGYTYTPEELKGLAQVLRKHKVLVLSDEIYGALQYDGQHTSIAKYYPEGTIVSGGLSKWCGAGGWRLGTFAFPEQLSWLRDAMATVASETFTSTSAPIQYAAIHAFLGSKDIDKYLINSRRLLEALANYICVRLNSAGIPIDVPASAFYVFPDFGPVADRLKKKGIGDCAQFCERLLTDTGVAVLPGFAFGRPVHELTVRMAFVDFDGAKALAAVNALGESDVIDEALLEAHCGRCTEAINRVCQWVTA